MPEPSALKAALKVTQQAIKILFDWTEINLANEFQVIQDVESREENLEEAIARAKNLLNQLLHLQPISCVYIWESTPNDKQLNSECISCDPLDLVDSGI